MKTLIFGCCVLHAVVLSAADPLVTRLNPLVGLLAELDEPDIQRDVLKGMFEAVKGQRDVGVPAKWSEVSAKLAGSSDAEVRKLTRSLSLIFGDKTVIKNLRTTITDQSASPEDRTKAIESFAQVRVPDLPKLLHPLLSDEAVRRSAIRALAVYADPQTPEKILEQYAKLTPVEKQAALQTLVSRKSFARALLKSLEDEHIPASDLTSYLVRQMVALGDPKMTASLRKVWGEFRPTNREKTQRIATLKQQLQQSKHIGDAAEGRRIFKATCANCHVLFDDGRQVGPNLTGSQRNNTDYVLENVLDPSAVVGRDFRLTTLATSDGRVLTGVIASETREALTLKTPTETVLLAQNDIETRKQSRLSMMPEGLFDKLTTEQLKDLLAYLASPQQVPPARGNAPSLE